MSFRTRVLVASVLLIWVPMAVLAVVTRREMTKRLTEEHTRRVETLVDVLEEDMEAETRFLRTRLRDLVNEIENDNRFRLQAAEGMGAERGYVLDYAGRAMRTAGLDMLRIHDENGRILSSGQFRNEFDRMDPLPASLGELPGRAALTRVRLPEEWVLALAVREDFRLGAGRFTLVGGREVTDWFLAGLSRDDNLAVTLVHPEGAASSHVGFEEKLSPGPDSTRTPWTEIFSEDRYLVETQVMPYVKTGGDTAAATLVVAYSRGPLSRLTRSLDLWLLVVLGVTVAGSLVLARWAASRVTRPLEDLAEKTLSADLATSGSEFRTDRPDEIGELSRFLAAMMRRLQSAARKLQDAERRVVVGELARQVNHDVKNGLIPIRNTFRHLTQVSDEDPEKLPAVFAERRKAIDEGIAYLENLSGNYARLYQVSPKKPCDLNAVVRRVAESRDGTPGVAVATRFRNIPPVAADPVALTRIVENLVSNAVESVAEAGGGSVDVTTALVERDGKQLVELRVLDTGPGIDPETRSRIFDDFFTTRSGGTGLGLSIVRRLVSDCEGKIRVESEKGKGATFIVEFPPAETTSRAGRPEEEGKA